MNKIIKALTGNLALKIISLVFAFVIWVLVTNNNNPIRSMTISNVPITIVNEDSIGDIGKVAEPEGSDTVTLKLTEEKWLRNLYGQDYADYMKRVNRCIPWPSRSTVCCGR